MKRITLLAGVLCALGLTACRSDSGYEDKTSDRPAGTAGSAHTNFDEQYDSQAGTSSAHAGSYGTGGTYGSTSASSKDKGTTQISGTAGSAHTDYDDKPSSTGTATASGASGSKEKVDRVAGTAGSEHRDYDFEHDSVASGDASAAKGDDDFWKDRPATAGGDSTSSTMQSSSIGMGTGGTSTTAKAGAAATAKAGGTANAETDPLSEGVGRTHNETVKAQTSTSSTWGTGAQGTGATGTAGAGVGATGASAQGSTGAATGSTVGVAEAASSRARMDAEATIAAWPQDAQKAARAMIQKYGQPSAVTEDEVCWKDNGPWKKTVVHRESVDHSFPAPHKDVLTQKVMMKVPADKIDDISQFDGSITVNRTAGWVSATCDMEEMNFAALNLAHEIASGKRTVEDARAQIAKVAADVKAGQKPDVAMRLAFQSDRGSADPDKPHTGGTSGVGTQPASAPKPGTEKKPDDTIQRDHPNKPGIDEVPDDEPKGDKPKDDDPKQKDEEVDGPGR